MRLLRLTFPCFFCVFVWLHTNARNFVAAENHAHAMESFVTVADDLNSLLLFTGGTAGLVPKEEDFIAAADDNATTDEDNTVNIDVLANDTEVASSIDPATVDIDTSTPGIQNSRVVSQGSFSVDASGKVTFTPAADYNGSFTVNYTVDDTSGSTSNEATINITVNPVNDKPIITGQTPVTVSATEDQDFTLALSNLVIVDPDNTTFTLTVLPGTNYSFTGTTITPSADYNGPLTVNVTVNDGTVDSDPFGVVVNASAVNDKPVITGQTPATLSATEDQSFSITLSNLVITDPDNSVFTLSVLSGTNYTFSGNTITPASDYYGALTVNVKVNDGTVDSDPFGVTVNIASVNDKPVITGQTPATIAATENQSFSISLTNLTVSDIDNASFTLSVLPGSNYTFSGNTITPSLNYNGPLTVNVKVNDGMDDSDSFGVAVNVGAVNDKPVITGQTPAVISATEDQSFTISLSDLIISDSDNSSFTLTILSGTDYTFSGTTITPASDYNGPLTVNVKVNDGIDDSDPFGVSINVASVNDKPVITGQSPSTISATEDTPFDIGPANLVISDPDNSSFSISILTGTNYTFAGNTITPSSNYNGPLSVNVKVNDGSNDSDPFVVAVNVAAVNDVPVITSQTPAVISATEDQSFSVSLSNLIISDADNSSFTLTVLPGTNYTFSGTTIAPASNYSGSLSVNVKVNDGTADSAPFGLSVNVTAVNDAPAITGQSPATLSATEDTDFTIALSNLTISDPDDAVFTLAILPGTNYTFSGTTITPASNYNGPLTVNVKVNDGATDSPSFGVAVNVAAVNDSPVITGQSSLSVNEDNAITLALSNLTVADPDNTYPAGFTMSVSAGANYTATGLKVTPAANFNGILTVPVTVSDGTNTSNTFNLQITVNAVNDTPVITGQSTLSINEGQSITLQLSQLVVSDPDNNYPADFTLFVLSGSNYSVSGNVVTPNANFNGTLIVKVFVHDGIASSNIYNLQIQVDAVNDVPVITGQQSLNMNEDSSITIKLSNLTVVDPDNTYPSDFTLTVLPGANYTVSGTTVTPAANFNGTLSVSVKVNDGTADSAPFSLQVTVSPVNDAPVITGQQTLSTNEDTSVTIQFSNLVVSDPDNTYPTGFTLTVLAGSNYTFSGNVVTPSANFNGTLSVQVRVNDGTMNSNTFGLQVQVNAVNDAPVITGQNSVSVNEDNAITLKLSDLIVSDPDNTYPTGFTLTVISGTHATVSGNTITPTANYNGTLTVSVKVSDGVAESAPTNISVTVNPVNDLPVFDSDPSSVLMAVVGDPYAYQINTSDIDDDPMTISAIAKPSWATLTVISNGKAKLSGIPTAASAGTFLVRLRVKDPTGSPVEQSYTLTINTRPVVTAFNLTTSEDININFQAQSFLDAFTDADGDDLSKIKITVLPKHGTLRLNSSTLQVNDEVAFSSIAQLVYSPVQNYSGNDTLYWNGADDQSEAYSNTESYISFIINPVNDAPIISIETDTLKYEVGKDFIPFTTLFNVTDVDDDSLILAEIGFRQQNYKSGVDVISFTNTAHVTGTFDAQSGVLTFSGKALISEYIEAIKTIQYKYANTSHPELESKSVYLTVSDGKSLSNTIDRFIRIIYTFEDLDIANGFTPNGDGVNDVWEVIKPEREDDLHESKLSIYDKSGQLVFESVGFEKKWDGTFKGQRLPSGSYYYTIDAVDSKLKSLRKIYKGVVTIF